MESTLRNARQFLGLTQAQMADCLGCSRNHYAQIERGVRLLTPSHLRHARMLVSLAQTVLFAGFYMVKRDTG